LREALTENSDETVNVKVKFFTTLREITGKREDNLSLPKGSTVEELLDELSRRYGPKFVEYVFDEGEVKPYLLVMVNGRSINFLNGLKTVLSENATVAILPPVGGG
jgi:molybdopterin synthase sulfur carrier subunit